MDAIFKDIGERRGSLSEEGIQVSDRVKTTRIVRAGLSEDGPVVCAAGQTGMVVKVESYEPDGVHVRLDSGNMWWFKPSQLTVI